MALPRPRLSPRCKPASGWVLPLTPVAMGGLDDDASRWWLPLAGAARGALAGAAATWLMDLVTTGMLGGQSEETTRREEAARPNGKPAVANLTDRIETAAGVSFTDAQRTIATRAIHSGLGIVPGARYGIATGPGRA